MVAGGDSQLDQTESKRFPLATGETSSEIPI